MIFAWLTFNILSLIVIAALLRNLFDLDSRAILAGAMPTSLLLVLFPVETPLVVGMLASVAGLQQGDPLVRNLQMASMLLGIVTSLVFGGFISAGMAGRKMKAHAACVGWMVLLPWAAYKTYWSGDVSFFVLMPIYSIMSMLGAFIHPSRDRSLRMLLAMICAALIMTVSFAAFCRFSRASAEAVTNQLFSSGH